MASPNTLARNAAMAHLRPNPVVLVDAGASGRDYRLRGQFQAALQQSAHERAARAGRDKAAREQAAAGRPGWTGIPTSGPGRRRAKGARNAAAVLATAAGA